MKKIIIVVCAIVFTITSAFVFHRSVTSGIHGTVSPAEAAKRIWAVNGRDSFSTAVQSGNFSVDVKPGTWRLHVEAMGSYKDAWVDNIVVEEGSYADAGEIKLVSSK